MAAAARSVSVGGGMSTSVGMRWFLVAGAVVALAVAGVASYYASPDPDGLERVAEDQGFIDDATDHGLADSPLADYGIAGVEDARLSVGLAGVVGVLATALVAGGGFWLLARRKGGDGDRRPSPAS
jgi:hypothetical protein